MELERVVGTNVFGAFATIRAFYPLLKVLLRCLLPSESHALINMTSASRALTAMFHCDHVSGCYTSSCARIKLHALLSCRGWLQHCYLGSQRPLLTGSPDLQTVTYQTRHHARRSPPNVVHVHPQRKTNGVKAVVTLSSSVAQMDRVSAAARALDAPLGPFDKFQFAYKVSKTGLNQGAQMPQFTRRGLAYHDYAIVRLVALGIEGTCGHFMRF